MIKWLRNIFKNKVELKRVMEYNGVRYYGYLNGVCQFASSGREDGLKKLEVLKVIAKDKPTTLYKEYF